MNEGTIKPFQNDSCVQFYLESFSDYYLHAVDVTHADRSPIRRRLSPTFEAPQSG